MASENPVIKSLSEQKKNPENPCCCGVFGILECHGAKSFVLQGAKYSDLCLSRFTSLFYPLCSSISLPLPPATPNPLPVPDLGILVGTPRFLSWFPIRFPLPFPSLFLLLFQAVVPSFWNHFAWAGSPDITAF